MSNPNLEFEDGLNSGLKDWGAELASGDYELHLWEPATGAEFIGARIQGRWNFEQRENAKWHSTPATKELIDLAEEFVAQREAPSTS